MRGRTLTHNRKVSRNAQVWQSSSKILYVNYKNLLMGYQITVRPPVRLIGSISIGVFLFWSWFLVSFVMAKYENGTSVVYSDERTESDIFVYNCELFITCETTNHWIISIICNIWSANISAGWTFESKVNKNELLLHANSSQTGCKSYFYKVFVFHKLGPWQGLFSSFS